MSQHSPSDLLQTIRAQRRRKHISQTQLGQMVKMPQSHLARIETGATDIRLSTLTEIARVLDLEPMLIPKHLVPSVSHMIEGPHKSSTTVPKLVGNEPEDLDEEL